ncbi:MAG: EamA family transporter [Candidatus Methanoperedenaceae archaeon]|nr:EamA family transporter [Candidatus Methanoperedenaceae archaeon]
MNWIIYAVACVFLYGTMHFFIKLASVNSNPVASSVFFVAAQFTAQLVLGAYFISKNGLVVDYANIKYSLFGGIVAGIATILFFLALQQAPISKVVPIVNLNVVVGVALGVILLNETMNLRIAAGVVFAMMSIYMLTNSG